MTRKELIDGEMQYRDLYDLQTAIDDTKRCATHLRDDDSGIDLEWHQQVLISSIRKAEATLASLKDLVKK
jgi:hypothetical protein